LLEFERSEVGAPVSQAATDAAGAKSSNSADANCVGGAGSDARKQLSTEMIVSALNERLPEGIRVTDFFEKPDRFPKSLASYVEAASYEIMCEGIDDAAGKLAAFFRLRSIIVEKASKKSGKFTETDIRDRMLDYRMIHDMRGRLLAAATLRAGAGNLLNPQVFFGAFCRQFGLNAELFTPVITRIEILGEGGKPLIEQYLTSTGDVRSVKR
jgi:hypothetical protein